MSVTAKEALRQLRKWKSILILLENRQLSQLSETVKGVDSHGNCKTHYKDPVIASAYKSDNRTTGGHVHYMAVRNCISYPVRDYLYHSYIRVWIRAGN